MTKDQTVAARELWRFGFAALELVDGFAFGQFNLADFNGEPQFGDVHFNGDHSNPQFADKRMGAAIAALGGIGHRQDEAFVPPRDGL